jgi:hypothetical protein
MGRNDSIAILGGYAIIHVTKMRSLIAALIMITDTMISAFPKVQLNLFFSISAFIIFMSFYFSWNSLQSSPLSRLTKRQCGRSFS